MDHLPLRPGRIAGLPINVERTALRIEQILRETMTEAEQAALAQALDLIDDRITERLQRMDWRELVNGGA